MLKETVYLAKGTVSTKALRYTSVSSMVLTILDGARKKSHVTEAAKAG